MKRKLLVGMMTVVLAFAITACGSTKEAVNTGDTNSVEDTADNLVENAAEATADVKKESGESEAVLTGELTFDVPEGFELDEASGTYEYTKDTTSVANIIEYSIPSDGSFSMVTKEIMANALETQLESAFGTDIILNIPVYENIEINGRPTIKYTIAYDFEGYSLEQTQYMIDDGDNYRYVTLTRDTADEFGDDFKAVENSIRFE